MAARRRKIRRALLIALLLALVLVGAVIALRLREYAAGADYYDALRIGLGR